MKLTKDMLRTIIKEEINQMDEIFGFGKKKKGKTVKVNTSTNFPVEHRFLSGIELAYDKSKDAFVGKELFTNNAPTKTFKNTPGDFYQGRSSEGTIYAIAFKRMFKKEAPAPGGASDDAEGAPSGDASSPAAKIANALGKRFNSEDVRVSDDVIAIRFSRQPVRAQKVYKKYGKTRGVSILKKLGYKNAKFTGKIIDQSFGTFTI
jgi:hypothetical protein